MQAGTQMMSDARKLNGRRSGKEARRPAAPAFTLIELMIVVAIIAVLASVLVIPALGAKMRGNETAAIAALRTLSTQQENFRSQAVVDQDGNGVGEYGVLGELAGVVIPRRNGATQPLTPRLIDTSFTATVSGFAVRNGYCYVIYLPLDGAEGAGTDADLSGDASTPGPILADGDGITRQQYYWCAYAWPASDNTGERMFFVDHHGVLYQTHGDVVKYSGSGSVPDAGAAYGVTVFTSQPASGNGHTGADGNVWSVVQ